MFYGCGVKDIDLSGVDFANLRDYSKMFNGSLATTIVVGDCNIENASYMFANCPNLQLVNLTEINFTNLNNTQGMFENDTKLLTIYVDRTFVPNSIVTSINMFKNCTSLTTAPELPATELSSGCYEEMFKDCSSLTTTPELPATELAESCYSTMFEGCTSLTTTPELPATRLASECYQAMFSDCTSLTVAPELPATELADGCYKWMLRNCTSLTAAPELPATTLVDGCYLRMFEGCTKIDYIKCLATDISANYCTYHWLDGTASKGTFVKHPNMSKWTKGNIGIPIGWTVVDAEL
jgi:hypothetical protein